MKEKFLALATLSVAAIGLTGFAPAQPQPAPPTTPSVPSLPPSADPSGLNAAYSAVANKVAVSSPQVPQAALKRALKYLQDNPNDVRNKDYVTVVDFTAASTKKRMYVVDTRSGAVEAYFSAHAKNSGENYATQFSNTDDSNMSSVGIYLTGDEYDGEHGRSMYLHGKESTNSNAYSRAIVMHGADYVSQDFIDQNGRLGRSLGCPAVELRYKDELVKKLEDGSVFYIYHSSFCGSTSCHL